MSKTNLTEEEKARIIEALNRDTEPSPELMEKLFPSLAEKFDVAKLDRAKNVTTGNLTNPPQAKYRG